MVSIIPFFLIIFNLISHVMGNKMSEMEKTRLESEMTVNRDKIAAFGSKLDGYMNDLMTSLKAEHSKGDVLKRFITAHPDLDNNVVQSINVVLTNSKMVDSKVTELLNRLDLSKKLLNEGNDANLKCLQMIVNYSDESSDGDYIKQACSNAQMSLNKAIEVFNNEQGLSNEVSSIQKLIMDSTNTFNNVQSIIDNFIQSNNNQTMKNVDPIANYPTPLTNQSIQTELPPINFTSDKDSKNPINGNLLDKTNSSPIPPIDTTGTPSLPLDGISPIIVNDVKNSNNPTLNNSNSNSNSKSNDLANAIYSSSGPINNNVRDYTDEEYAVLLERIRKSMEFQNNLMIRNRLYLSKFDEVLTSVNKSKEVLKGAISSIPRVSVDYDQTILQFDKLTENSDDIERALGEIKTKLVEDVNLLTQLTQESKNCVENLVVKSSIMYNRCIAVFNYWNDNSQRLQLDQNDSDLFRKAEIINKSMKDMLTSIKSSGMFVNKDASDNETRDVPVAQTSDEEFVSELSGTKPLTQTQDVIQMANDANDLIKSIEKEMLYSESSFNNNYQLAQESQTEIEILSKNPVFSNPIHSKFFDECKQVLRNAQVNQNNNTIATNLFSKHKDEIKEIKNDLTTCISSLTNMNEHSDEKKSVMEKCRQATLKTTKLNDVLKGDEFQNLITNMENSAKTLSQHAISMRSIAKADSPLVEPSNNNVSGDSPSGINNNLRSREVEVSPLLPSSAKIVPLSLLAILTIASI